jgi:hypothetical protein
MFKLLGSRSQPNDTPSIENLEEDEQAFRDPPYIPDGERLQRNASLLSLTTTSQPAPTAVSEPVRVDEDGTVTQPIQFSINYNHLSGDKPSPTANAREASDKAVPDSYLSALAEEAILVQYERLAQTCPSGVYVLPDRDSLYLWHGVIFVHSGPYSQGIFRFIVDIPSEYPAAAPAVRFTSRVAHPMVCSRGFLDLRLFKVRPSPRPIHHLLI